MTDETPPRREGAVHFLRNRDAWIRWVLEAEISPSAKVVGVHIAMRMNVTEQQAWPNVKTMGKMLYLSPRHVSRALVELADLRALWIFRDRGRGNRYKLRLPTDP